MSHFTAKDINGLFLKAYSACMMYDYNKAIEYGQNLYEASSQYYGPIHTNTIESLNSLVVYCQEANRLEEALNYALLSYEKTKEVYGINHDKTKNLSNTIDVLKNKCPK